jgi:hypothetical protein
MRAVPLVCVECNNSLPSRATRLLLDSGATIHNPAERCPTCPCRARQSSTSVPPRHSNRHTARHRVCKALVHAWAGTLSGRRRRMNKYSIFLGLTSQLSDSTLITLSTYVDATFRMIVPSRALPLVCQRIGRSNPLPTNPLGCRCIGRNDTIPLCQSCHRDIRLSGPGRGDLLPSTLAIPLISIGRGDPRPRPLRHFPLVCLKHDDATRGMTNPFKYHPISFLVTI